MVQDKSTFFGIKKNWSVIKDELLRCYLKPYVAKILHTGRPLIYVDCFAGKGKFEDGNDGSPLIALKTIEDCLNNTKSSNQDVQTFFIEKNYASELNANLSGYQNVRVVGGAYEKNITSILENRQGSNAFLYIDPYGVMDLNFNLFENDISQSLYSIELLINMNSFGFIREACRATSVTFTTPEIFDDLVEYEPVLLQPSQQSIINLTRVAGGDYWRGIIEDYKSKSINAYEAEQQFSQSYCKRLGESYRYVLNMPIRLKRGQQPKYRMIHATNHADGCVLMYENMSKRWQLLEDMQTAGQASLFDQSVENIFIDKQQIASDLKKHVQKYRQETPINDVKAAFLTEYGVLCSPAKLTSFLQKMEKSGTVLIRREPSTTPGGKPATFFSVNSRHRIWIRSAK
jgi:three-Cys-motif partner protein